MVTATSFKETWDNVQKEFQGNGKINTIRLQNLRKDLENLSMEFKENINDYYTRVTIIVNQIKMYGDEIKEEDIVNKNLCTVIEAYGSAAGVIESTKDLSTLISIIRGVHDESSRKKE